MLDRGHEGFRAYSQSKLALITLTFDVADGLADAAVQPTPCTPPPRCRSVPSSGDVPQDGGGRCEGSVVRERSVVFGPEIEDEGDQRLDSRTCSGSSATAPPPPSTRGTGRQSAPWSATPAPPVMVASAMP
jgi:hypothetical protein